MYYLERWFRNEHIIVLCGSKRNKNVLEDFPSDLCPAVRFGEQEGTTVD